MPYGYRQVQGSEGLGSISGVVSSLPAGYSVGEARIHDGGKYRLVYNAGNSQISKGRHCKFSTTVGVNYGSVTVSTVTETVTAAVGVVVHATLTTGTYGWALQNNVGGTPVALLVSNISIATGALIMPAADGNHTLTTTSTVAVGRNVGDTTTGTGTTDAVSGRFVVWYDLVPIV